MWHEGLWGLLRSFNIDERLVKQIKHYTTLLKVLYSCFFEATVGVDQGCLLSPVLFNRFLERIMCETFENNESSISIGG